MRLFALLSIALLALGLTLPASRAAEFNDTQQDEIRSIVKDYLLKNPDVIREVFGILRKQDAEREQADAAKRAEVAKKALAANKEEIFNGEGQIILGNPDGDVTLVEFLDYNCGYCKQAFGSMLKLIDGDKKLRIVLKEWPVLGQQSLEAALVAVAVTRVAPEKYWDFHKGMMVLRGTANKESALRVAEKLGIPRAKLEELYEDKSLLKPIEASYRLADALQLTGTPGYVLEDEIIPGFLPVSALKKKIKDVRTCGSTSC